MSESIPTWREDIETVRSGISLLVIRAEQDRFNAALNRIVERMEQFERGWDEALNRAVIAEVSLEDLRQEYVISDKRIAELEEALQPKPMIGSWEDES